MGAFSHTQTNLFGSGVNLNVSLPSIEEHKPFSSLIKGQNTFLGKSNFGKDSSMSIDDSIFNKIK